MEFTDLSLASNDRKNCLRLPIKRKSCNVEEVLRSSNSSSTTTTHVDLDHELKHPLPSDWEQCLDLQSGRMYYVNKKTSRKSWNCRPPAHDQEEHINNTNKLLDLDLNISSGNNNSGVDYIKQNLGSKSTSITSSSSSSSTMALLACSNCHLLVILCRSSPSCPNCKYVHPLHDTNSPFMAPFN